MCTNVPSGSSEVVEVRIFCLALVIIHYKVDNLKITVSDGSKSRGNDVGSKKEGVFEKSG